MRGVFRLFSKNCATARSLEIFKPDSIFKHHTRATVYHRWHGDGMTFLFDGEGGRVKKITSLEADNLDIAKAVGNKSY